MKKLFMFGGAAIVIVLLFAIPFKKPNSTPKNSDMPQTPYGNILDLVDEQTTVYEMDKEASSLHWYATRIVGNDHEGYVPFLSGYVLKKDEAFTQGEFIMDLTNISESKDNQRFLTHLASDDFFHVEQYPTSTLFLKEITKTEDREGINDVYLITADLTIKNISNEISFLALVMDEEERIQAQADFMIDRTKWDMTYDSGTIFQQIGDKAIKDDIQYTITLVLNKRTN